MDVFEAVDSRIACRQFFDKPVDPKIVKDLLARAARAASGGNLQSWNIYALTGKVTSFMGPTFVALATTIFASQQAGLAVLIAFFLTGGALLVAGAFRRGATPA